MLQFPILLQAAIYPSSYNIVYHRISLTVDPGVSGAISSGSVTTYFTTTAASVSQVGFDFDSRMNVSTVFYHGSSLATYTFSADVITINFPSALAPMGKLDSVTINFSGTPAAPATSIPSGYNYVSNSIYTLGEAFTGSTWWPCKDSLVDKIDSVDLIITSPIAYRAAGNGVVTETVTGPNRTCTWKTRHPIATYMINFAVADYVNYPFTATSLGHTVTVMNYLHAADNNTTYKSALNVLTSIMPAYATLLNTDYPFYDEKYGTAECGTGWGALEVQSMTFIDRTQYGGGGAVLAHELAHQWFGDKLTTNDWHQIWLNEGFAQYFQQVIFPEQLQSAATAASQRSSLKNSVNSSSTTYCSNISNCDNIFFGAGNAQPYEKGAMTVSMLRSWLGETPFFTALYNYLNAPGLAYNFTSVDSLQKYMQAQTPNNLANFFTAWVNQQGRVTYTVNYQYVAGGAYIQLIQAPTVSGAGYFDMPVPIEFKNSTGLDTTVVLVDRGGKLYNSVTGYTYNSNTFYVPLSATPTVAPVLDPNSNVLAASSSVNNSTTLSTLITLPLYFTDLAVTGFGNQATLSWHITSDVPVASLDVEKSADGSKFSAAARQLPQMPAGNGYDGSWQDRQVINGLNYYRVRVNKQAGGYFYSPVKIYNSHADAHIGTYPNPVTGSCLLQLPAGFSNKDINLKIYSVAGVLADERDLHTGSQLTVSFDSFTAGIYQLVLTDKVGSQLQTRIVKQ